MTERTMKVCLINDERVEYDLMPGDQVKTDGDEDFCGTVTHVDLIPCTADVDWDESVKNRRGALWLVSSLTRA